MGRIMSQVCLNCWSSAWLKSLSNDRHTCSKGRLMVNWQIYARRCFVARIDKLCLKVSKNILKKYQFTYLYHFPVILCCCKHNPAGLVQSGSYTNLQYLLRDSRSFDHTEDEWICLTLLLSSTGRGGGCSDFIWCSRKIKSGDFVFLSKM